MCVEADFSQIHSHILLLVCMCALSSYEIIVHIQTSYELLDSNTLFNKASEHANCSYRPTLTGEFITHLEARSIALKLLALSSTHVKMITELCNER